MKGTYKELLVWQKAHRNTLDIYRLTKSFPDEEKFGITSQLRRAIVSVELNIVEGKYRKSAKEFQRFLFIARASNQEVHCILEISKDLAYINKNEHMQQILHIEEVNKMLNGLINSLS